MATQPEKQNAFLATRGDLVNEAMLSSVGSSDVSIGG